MATRSELDINEDSSGKLTCTLEDENGDPVTLAAMGSITMTFIETKLQAPDNVVNSRSAQNVLNTANCTFHATTGLFTWNIQIADTDIVNTATPIGHREEHLATVTFLWSSGTKQHHHEFLLNVLNLRSVPQA